ncbi:unnamed protein product [Danaus chrysippus]|uniref:(African queen) hypothetical protein n=1 Tax=Danaus chrysippus TaxID=151541 RepID=A0A8J2QNN2_9NEOP|nr:unnamed protein product [Danaus chrysippus]
MLSIFRRWWGLCGGGGGVWRLWWGGPAASWWLVSADRAAAVGVQAAPPRRPLLSSPLLAAPHLSPAPPSPAPLPPGYSRTGGGRRGDSRPRDAQRITRADPKTNSDGRGKCIFRVQGAGGAVRRGVGVAGGVRGCAGRGPGVRGGGVEKGASNDGHRIDFYLAAPPLSWWCRARAIDRRCTVSPSPGVSRGRAGLRRPQCVLLSFTSSLASPHVDRYSDLIFFNDFRKRAKIRTSTSLTDKSSFKDGTTLYDIVIKGREEERGECPSPDKVTVAKVASITSRVECAGAEYSARARADGALPPSEHAMATDTGQ